MRKLNRIAEQHPEAFALAAAALFVVCFFGFFPALYVLFVR